jgi:hypothetical protein
MAKQQKNVVRGCKGGLLIEHVYPITNHGNYRSQS